MNNLQEDSKVSYFRNFIFGVEDSLVSTVALLSGIAIAGVPRATIFITGAVLIFVEAFSMAAGSFLSESSVEEYENIKKVSIRRSLIDGLVMFFSYFFSGLLPLFPYLIWQTESAFSFSVIISLISLFCLGLVGAKFSKKPLLRRGMRMLIIGGIAILMGIIAGQIADNFTS